MERQGKQAMEQAMREKEKERMTISKRWTKREEADFFRVASSFGVIYYRKKKIYDWMKFKQLAKLEKKPDEELTEYYKHFVIMCKKQTGMNVEEGSYDLTIEHINEEKARRTLERLELLSRIREEVLTHPKLDERLKVCLTSADMPDWWVPGKHDKDLLIGVAKHGLGRTDYYLLNDPELSFQDVLRKKVNLDTSENKEAIKLESHEDILKFDKDEILVKLEKGEGTLKIEKVAVKKEPTEEKEKKATDSKVELTIIKSEKCAEKSDASDFTLKDEDEKSSASKESKEEECKTDQDAKLKEPESNKSDQEKPADYPENLSKDTSEYKFGGDKKDAKSFEKQMEEEVDLCSKQAAELKAMFPDLEVIQPLSRLSQIDTFVLRDKQGSGALDFSETTVAQLFNSAVKWPKEYAIQVRLQHIIYAVETKEWPASKTFSAYATGIGSEIDIPVHELPNEPAPPPKRESSTPMSVHETDMSFDREAYKKHKRHIAIDVETERAKLHALLNSSHMANNPLPKHGMGWENDDSGDSKRSTPIPTTLQPPPAHQQTTRMMNMPFDLKYHTPAKTIGQTTVIPGTSSTLTPIDLSSSIPKNTDKHSPIDMSNEAQDFSLKKQQPLALNVPKSGNKLDDTLSKLMKRKNCPVEEPVVGKEKKRRKLDEIVLGLSAAKEQSLFPETTKKPPVTPSVTVTPTSAPVSTSHNPTQKPFTITVTSVPSTAAPPKSTVPNIIPSLSGTSKDTFSNYLAQAEQQNLMLKKQQMQQRKSYEAMIADIGKVSDFSSKINTYSHEAKVNKWLAEQNAALAEQPLGADYLSARRRRPRIDPTLLDWKKLTGEENVAVIHRLTGKKLTGPKAPTLKRLGQWLIENPNYDIDPKWSELVKERGNLSHDLQKRLPGSSGGKKSQPGRPPLLASPTGSTSSVNSANINTSLPSSLSFPNLTGAGLGGLNSNLLSGLSGLGQFDPKNNPLLMPFAGLPNMGALGSMGGLGNLTNMNLFANLAGLGIPGLGAMEASALAGDPNVSGKASSSKASSTATKSQKPQDAHTSSKSGASSSSPSNSSNIPTTNPFPFFFPNPSLLYTPLGLGGLNPFTLQPGMAAYDTLAQQCGLLNGGNMNPMASPSSGSKASKASSSASRPPSVSNITTVTTTSQSTKAPRPSSRDVQFQQLLLPPDTQILESITRAASSLDASFKQQSKEKKDEKRKALESLRGMLPTDFSQLPVSQYKDKKGGGIPALSDFTKLLEAQVTQAQSSLKKTHEQQMKEALEQLSRSNAELMAKALAEEQAKLSSLKRPREPESQHNSSFEDDTPLKKLKEAQEKVSCLPPPIPNEQEGVDIETLLPPSTVVKCSSITNEKPEDLEKKKQAASLEKPPTPVPEPEKSVIEPTPVSTANITTDTTAAAAIIPPNSETEEPPVTPPVSSSISTTASEPVTQGANSSTTTEITTASTTSAVSAASSATTTSSSSSSSNNQQESVENPPSPPKKPIKRTRGKRKSGDLLASLDHESVIEKKNLRSSASRSAAAAAARAAAAEQAAARQLEAAKSQSSDGAS